MSFIQALGETVSIPLVRHYRGRGRPNPSTMKAFLCKVDRATILLAELQAIERWDARYLPRNWYEAIGVLSRLRMRNEILFEVTSIVAELDVKLRETRSHTLRQRRMKPSSFMRPPR